MVAEMVVTLAGDTVRILTPGSNPALVTLLSKVT